MSSKIEAKRFSGKPGTWAHYEMAVRAHFAIVDLIEHLNDGAGLSGDKREEWRKAQLKIYSFFLFPIFGIPTFASAGGLTPQPRSGCASTGCHLCWPLAELQLPSRVEVFR